MPGARRAHKPLHLMTWNINSVRARLGHLLRIARETEPDIICLQETKVRDDAFPLGEISGLGYVHHALNGQKSYNGVAILSRLPFLDVARLSWVERSDARHVAVTLAGGIELHNFYVPAGGDLPDPVENEKFAHKLAFLDEMAAWGAALDGAGEARRILVGDLNIAPLENDVWSHRQLLNVVSHTPVEVEKLNAVQNAHGWLDAMRALVPEREKLYTWWSYRSPDFEKNDRGRRLDHVWLGRGLRPALEEMTVMKDARRWDRPSDHAPVFVTLAP